MGSGRRWSAFGTYITLLALQTLVVLTLHGTAQDVGWLNSARWFPYLAFGLVVGALVDRHRRRPVMITTDLDRAALLVVIPVLWALGVLSLPLLLVVVTLYGTASLVNDAASMSFLPRLVPRAQGSLRPGLDCEPRWSWPPPSSCSPPSSSPRRPSGLPGWPATTTRSRQPGRESWVGDGRTGSTQEPGTSPIEFPG